MDLRTYLRALGKMWWLVVVTTVAVGAIAAGYTATITKKYSSTVTFFVSTPTSATGTPLQADQFIQRRLPSYVGLLTSQRLASAVISDTHINMTPSKLSKLIAASTPANTVLLKATVTDSSAAQAQQIAGSIATQFGGLVHQFDSFGAKAAASPIDLEVISGPTTNGAAVSPKSGTNIGLGIIVGFFLGLVAVALREALGTGLQTEESVRALSGAPVLGVIGADRKAKKAPFLLGEQAHSARAESFRQLRTNVQFAHADAPAKVVVVTSASAQEGKTSTAANLALTYAEAGFKTVLVEADLRNPRLIGALGLSRGVGLSNALAGQVGADDVLQPWGETGVSVLAGGPVPPNPAELLGSQNMTILLGQLRQRFDVVILDTPAILPVTDAVVLSALADGVIVVVRRGKTTPAQLSAVVNTLDGVDARVLGTVFTWQQGGQADTRRTVAQSAKADSHWLDGTQDLPVPVSSASGKGGPSSL